MYGENKKNTFSFFFPEFVELTFVAFVSQAFKLDISVRNQKKIFSGQEQQLVEWK